MDAIVVAYVVSEGKRQEKEKQLQSVLRATNTTTQTTTSSTISSIIGLAIATFAVYLSWSCNTSQGYGTAEKVFYAICAFLFGMLYLIYYLLVRAGTCMFKSS
jgi:H+/Cl- antiporter ClcA